MTTSLSLDREATKIRSARERCISIATIETPYFRLHGTNEPASIGSAVSSGCIRLFNQDIIDLYNRVPVGTSVTVLQG
jgi:lipoprotein-anchoring transpeptidase ErfK/SrfK